MWEGLGDFRKNRKDVRDGYERRARTGYRYPEIDAWNQVPMSTKILLAVFGGLLALFLLLILVRRGPLLMSWSSVWDSIRWNRADDLLVPTPRPGAPVAVLDRETRVFSGPGEDYEAIGIL